MTVLCLHGFTSGTWTLRPTAEALAGVGWDVVLPTFRGHGPGESPAGLRWEDWVAEAEEWCRVLGNRGEPVVILGLSMGATIAAEIASRVPGVAGLILVNPVAETPAAQRVLLAQALAAGLTELPATAAEVRDPAADRGPARPVPLLPLVSVLDGAARVDWRAVRVPTLLFSSAHDGVLDPSHGEQVASLVSGVRRVRLADSAHVATLDHDRAHIEAECLAFLDRLHPTLPAGRLRVGPGTTPRATRLLREHLEPRGWCVTEGADWSLWWGTATPADAVQRRAGPGRRVNHLPGIAAITRKDTLALTMELDRRRGQTQADRQRVHPETWLLPDDRSAFERAARRSPRATWIQKPATGSDGRGIQLWADAASVPTRPGTVVQRYLARPHLWEGFKYTLRCYVAITAGPELRAFFFDDGFVKLTSRPWPGSREALDDRSVHLTNPGIQRRKADAPVSARNLTHRAWRERIRATGIDDAALFARIHGVARRAVSAALPFVRSESARLGVGDGAFELLGLDVLVDARLRPWLLECNLSPSLVVEADDTTPAAREEAALKRELTSALLVLAGILRGRGGIRELPEGEHRVFHPIDLGADPKPPLARTEGGSAIHPGPKERHEEVWQA